jgi:hypothetical protein
MLPACQRCPEIRPPQSLLRTGSTVIPVGLTMADVSGQAMSLLGGLAAGAKTEQFETVAVDANPLPAARTQPDLRRQGNLVIHLSPAGRANQMVVAPDDGVVAAGPMAKFQLGGQAAARQPIQSVVNRGEGDSRPATAHQAIDFRRSRMRMPGA